MVLRSLFLSGLVGGVFLVSCSSSDPAMPDNNDTTSNDNRPPGTVLMLIPFADQCELTDDTYGYLYDDIPNISGELIDSQLVENRELRFFLPPSTGLYWLVVKNPIKELVTVSFQTSERDLQFDPDLSCN